jgi:hypothetical protein
MDRKEPQFSKCLVLTSNALLFQLGGLVLAGGIFLLTSEWNDLDSDAINNIVFFALVLGCLWVGIGLFGCCTLTCRLRRLEYLFLLVVLITTAATGYSIYVLGYTSDNLKVETYPANDYCYETQDFTRAEEDLQTNFNDLYVKFQNDNNKYRFFYDWCFPLLPLLRTHTHFVLFLQIEIAPTDCRTVGMRTIVLLTSGMACARVTKPLTWILAKRWKIVKMPSRMMCAIAAMRTYVANRASTNSL